MKTYKKHSHEEKTRSPCRTACTHTIAQCASSTAKKIRGLPGPQNGLLEPWFQTDRADTLLFSIWRHQPAALIESNYSPLIIIIMKKTPEERKKMLLLVLPVVLLLAAGLGYGAYYYTQNKAWDHQTVAQGINTHLPGAQIKSGPPVTKMTAYNQAQTDSAAAKNKSAATAFAALGWGSPQPPTGAVANNAAASEVQINRKLAEITRQVNTPEPAPPKYTAQPAASNPDIDHLEKLLKQRQQASQPDPEMAQLNSMLDKIQQIQNPALAKIQPQSSVKPDSAFKAIPAIIDGNQKVMNGGVVKLRLSDTLCIHNTIIPKGALIFGSCSVTNQRLLLEIKNIRMGTSIIPVNLTIFSLDGMPGLAAPEADLGEAAGNGAAAALDNMEFLGMDQTLGTQAATAGIAAAKGLIGKKARKIKVRLKGGTPVLLRNNEQQR